MTLSLEQKIEYNRKRRKDNFEASSRLDWKDVRLAAEGGNRVILNLLATLSRERQVGFSITYEQGSGLWYFEINSCAESEAFISKDLALENMICDLVEYLKPQEVE